MVEQQLGSIALIYAIENGHTETAHIRIKKGADINAKNKVRLLYLAWIIYHRYASRATYVYIKPNTSILIVYHTYT